MEWGENRMEEEIPVDWNGIDIPLPMFGCDIDMTWNTKLLETNVRGSGEI